MTYKDMTFCVNKTCKIRHLCERHEENLPEEARIVSLAKFECLEENNYFIPKEKNNV